MRIGKLSNRELKEIVFSQLPELSPDTIVGPAVGSDCVWAKSGGAYFVASTDPITAGGQQAGRLSIHVSCNDIATCGVKASGMLVVFIAPPTICRDELEAIVRQTSQTARELGVDIVGGHTEVSDSVNRLVVVTTAYAHIGADIPVPCGRAQIGDTLIMTKTAAIEGTWILSMEKEAVLKDKLDKKLLLRAKKMLDQLSVVHDGLIAASVSSDQQHPSMSGQSQSSVHLMHDVTEGGVLGAAYEMAELSGLGLIIHKDSIPIDPATDAITKVFKLDPLRLMSSGSMLIATDKPDLVITALENKHIRATAIGYFNDDKTKSCRDAKGKIKKLDPPMEDELYKVM